MGSGDSEKHEIVPTPAVHQVVETGHFLWQEYSYRHDLIWRLLFRMTAVASLLSIAPFTVSPDTRAAAGVWIYLLPVLAAFVVLISWILLHLELRLFLPINEEYVRVQTEVVGRRLRPVGRRDFFKGLVHFWPPLLLALVMIATSVAWAIR